MANLTREEQRQLAKEVIDGLRDVVIADIINRIPEDWDGYEIKQLIADTLFERWVVVMSKARKRDYDNDRATLNL